MSHEPTIEIEVKIDEKLHTSLPISDVIEAINDAPMTKRWNYVAQLINGIQLSASELTDEQKAIVKSYLVEKTALFK